VNHKIEFPSRAWPASGKSALFPNIVNVCVIRGECPCRCIHCPVGLVLPEKRAETFGKREMELSVFKNIVDQMSEFHHSFLRIHGVGEPILWKHLEDGLLYARNRLNTWIFTCGLAPLNVLKLLVYSCSIIEVSVNSTNKEDYIKTKGIDAFEEVKNNIDYMRTLVAEQQLNTRIIATRVESDDEKKDQEFVTYWKRSGLVEDTFVRSYHNYNKLLPKGPGTCDSANKVVPCSVHWTRFNIDCDGNGVVCFNELFKGPTVDSSLILGNVKDSLIQMMWQGEKISSIRQAQLRGDYSVLGSLADHLPCVHCEYCQPLNSHRLTSENQTRKFDQCQHGQGKISRHSA